MERCRVTTNSCLCSFSSSIYQLLQNVELLGMTMVLVLAFSTACVPGDCKKIVPRFSYNYDDHLPIYTAPKSHSTSSSLQVQHLWEYPSEELLVKEKLSNPSDIKRNKSIDLRNTSLHNLAPIKSKDKVSVNSKEYPLSMKENQQFYRVRKADPEEYFMNVDEDDTAFDEIRCNSAVMGTNLDCIKSEIARHLKDLMQMGPIRLSQYIQIVENPDANHKTNYQKRAAGHRPESELWSVVERFLESRMLKVKVPELFGLIPGFNSIARIHNGRVEVAFESTDDSHFEGYDKENWKELGMPAFHNKTLNRTWPQEEKEETQEKEGTPENHDDSIGSESRNDDDDHDDGSCDGCQKSPSTFNDGLHTQHHSCSEEG